MLNKNTYLVLIILVLIIIISGIQYFGERETETSIVETETAIENQIINSISEEEATTIPLAPNGSVLPTMSEDGAYLVYYFNDGFSPNILQIKSGSSVRFINKSDMAMRVYSSDQNLARYREFNQPNSVGKDGIYGYSFVQEGVWPYMNYNNQSHIANILVY